jgi:type I restriction enzyme S subunit
VPQAPNDEPASELLARLRAARAAAPAPKAPRAPRKNARSRQQVAAA